MRAASSFPTASSNSSCRSSASATGASFADRDEVGYGLDFAPAKAMTLNNIYVRWFEADRFARARRRGEGVGRGRLRPPQQDDTRRRGQLAHAPARYDLRLGFVVARRVGLWGELWQPSPLEPRTHWEQLYLPALSPIAVATGQTLSAKPAVDHLLRTRHQRDVERSPSPMPQAAR